MLNTGVYRTLSPHSFGELDGALFYIEYQVFTTSSTPIRLWKSNDRGATWSVQFTFQGHRHAHDAGRGGGLLERPASAVRWIPRVAGPDRKVGDLPRRAVRSAVQLAVQDEPHADAGADPQVHEAVHVAPVAARALADGGQVHVVLEAEVGAQLMP